jgi:hypothetical protein
MASIVAHVAFSPVRSYYIDGFRVRVLARNPASAAYYFCATSTDISQYDVKVFNDFVTSGNEDWALDIDYSVNAIAILSTGDKSYYIYQEEVAPQQQMEGIIRYNEVARKVGTARFVEIICSLGNEKSDCSDILLQLGDDVRAFTVEQVGFLVEALKARKNQDKFYVLRALYDALDEDFYKTHVQALLCPAYFTALGRSLNDCEFNIGDPFDSNTCLHCGMIAAYHTTSLEELALLACELHLQVPEKQQEVPEDLD